MEQQRDAKLWQTAKARAAFKRNLFAYIVMNLFFWLVWWFSAGADFFEDRRGIPWPVWVTLGWGLGMAFHYFRAYQGSRTDIAEEEYEKLRQQKKG